MPNYQPTILNPTEGAVYSAVGDLYRFLATGNQTGGAFTLVEVLMSPGGGPPPHIHHREDETFYVLEGEITFRLGDRKFIGRPGSFVLGPRGLPHGFKNESTATARMLVQISPAGFENFLKEFAHPVPSLDTPPRPVEPADIEKILAVASKYGIEILPPEQ